jgi:acetylornithine deacetylase/succinyl-diaminopimelate desuccinylase-like protein
MLDEWTQEQIEADVLERGSVPSDQIREQFWLRKIRELDVWPLLLICGANHFTSFAALLSAGHIDVVEVHPDWEHAANRGCCEL